MDKKGVLPERRFIGGTNKVDDIDKGIKVYKYMPNNDHLCEIIAGQLYFSTPKMFNDILDSKIRISEDRIKSLDELSSDYKRLWYYPNEKPTVNSESFKATLTGNDVIHEVNNKNGILCLSELNPLCLNSHHMWGLYGGIGKGFVAEYSLHDLCNGLYTELVAFNQNEATLKDGFNRLSEFDVQAQSVEYVDKWNPLENLKNCYSSQKSEEFNNYLLYYLTKHRVWENEQELRFVVHPKQKNSGCWQDSYKFKTNIKPTNIYFGWQNELSCCLNLKCDGVGLHKIINNINYDEGRLEIESWVKDLSATFIHGGI